MMGMLRPYSIGMAARLAGVEPDTLRMWERRYGFTDPERTVGGHRLYSDDDVALLRAVRKLVEGGARVGALAALDRQAILELASGSSADAAAQPQARDPYEALVDDVIDAARAFDAGRAGALLDRPRLNLEGRDVVRLVYLPLLRRVGDLWSAGGLPVAVEHFVEKLVSARMHGVLAATPDGRGARAVCACPPGERHEGGLVASAIELRLAGYRVTLLGADTPVDDIVDTVRATRAQLLVLAVTVTVAVKPDLQAKALVRALDETLRDVPLVIGGASARELTRLLKRKDVAVPPSVEALPGSAPRPVR